ncbi:MAG: glycoside hydrolase family protein [Planctomycetota bacterium]
MVDHWGMEWIMCRCWKLVICVVLAGSVWGCGDRRPRHTEVEEFPRELVDFVEYEGNPLFGGTGEDTWDRNIRERGFIMREGDMYHMWYTGYNDEWSDTKYLGYATSRDGFEWRRYEGNPIFTERWVEDMFVVKHEGTYYMFAEGRGDIAHMLTSKDGVHWEDQGDLDVRYTTGERLSPGPYGTPTVLIEGDVWYLFYERDDLHVWVAKSRDLKVWRNVQDEPVLSPGPEAYDGRLIALDYMIRHEGKYYAYYHGIGPGTGGQEWGPWSSSVAVSTDLVSWRKYPQNPIVIANSPILVENGRVYRLYCMHPEVRLYFPQGYRAGQ